MYTDRILQIRLVFSEEQKPFLLDITSLLYDFELLHDLCVLTCVDEYKEFNFSQYFWYRGGRPLKEKDRLRTIRIIKESPLVMELLMGATAFLALVQAIEKINNWKLNRKKLELEVETKQIEKEMKKIEKEKLERESSITYYKEQREKVELGRAVEERKALDIFHGLLRRLETNPIKLLEIDMVKTKEKDGKER